MTKINSIVFRAAFVFCVFAFPRPLLSQDEEKPKPDLAKAWAGLAASLISPAEVFLPEILNNPNWDILQDSVSTTEAQTILLSVQFGELADGLTIKEFDGVKDLIHPSNTRLLSLLEGYRAYVAPDFTIDPNRVLLVLKRSDTSNFVDELASGTTLVKLVSVPSNAKVRARRSSAKKGRDLENPTETACCLAQGTYVFICQKGKLADRKSVELTKRFQTVEFTLR